MSSNPLTAGLRPVHPGAVLREDVLPALGKSKSEIAVLLRISRQQLYDILNEQKPVSTRMALRLGKLCGNGPELWLRLQEQYDLSREAAAMEAELDAIPTLEVA